MDRFTARLIIPGILLTIIGPLFLLSPDLRWVGVRLCIAGPLAFAVGLYLLKRK
jgi:hypothetical protein